MSRDRITSAGEHIATWSQSQKQKKIREQTSSNGPRETTCNKMQQKIVL